MFLVLVLLLLLMCQLAGCLRVDAAAPVAVSGRHIIGLEGCLKKDTERFINCCGLLLAAGGCAQCQQHRQELHLTVVSLAATAAAGAWCIAHRNATLQQLFPEYLVSFNSS